MKVYPFLIVKASGRVKKVMQSGLDYKNAVSRVLATHPSKFVKLKFAINMNLIETKLAAKAAAKKESIPMYVFVANADISDCKYNANPTMDGHRVVCLIEVNGKEKKVKPVEQSAVKVYAGENVTQKAVPKNLNKLDQQPSIVKNLKSEQVKPLTKNKNENTKAMSTQVKTKPAKKAAKKKVVAKKATAKKSVSAADWGKKVSISIKDMRAGIKKGNVYRDPQGVIQTEKYLVTRAKQDYVREGMYVGKAA